MLSSTIVAQVVRFGSQVATMRRRRANFEITMPDQEAVNFKALFESAPQLYLVLTPNLNIVAASDAYLRATMTVRAEILGRNLFDVFPDNPEDSSATGFRNLSASLDIVLKSAIQHTMAVQKYDIRRSDAEGGFEERYWSPVNSPVLDENGNVIYIIHRVEDVTEFVRLKQQGSKQSQLTEELRDRAEKMESEVFLRAQEIQERTRELEIVNRELQSARDQAIKASRFKSDFLANMSHEIRTPMNGILGMAEIVLRSDLPPKLREHVTVIRDAGRSLLSVVNDILDFSKIEAGKLFLELIEYEPVRLVESVGELLAEQARSKNLSLVTFIDPSVPHSLCGDPVRLRQILVNLAGNAVKFSERGEVSVKVSMESEQSDSVSLRFSVSDQGVGLSKEESDRLFQPFVQGDGSMTRKYGGTGLGLSISRHLVELMGGEIGVESKKGEGCLFWFSVQQQRCVASEKSTARINLREVKALVVDDELHSRNAISSYLSSWGIENRHVGGGEEALNLLHEAVREGQPYQLAIVDLVMPGMTGADLAVAIQADALLSNTKLIVVTAFDRPGWGEDAIELGFDACLTKPLKQSQLFDCVAAVMFGAKASSRSAQTRYLDVERQYSALSTSLKRPELILVVEDHQINQQVALLLLHDLGFEAHVANNGREAVEVFSRAPYSLVLMDVQMPELNGFDATRAIRRIEARTGKHVPIIAMTAHAIEGSSEACVAAGMDDYLSKPVDPVALKATIRKWLPANGDQVHLTQEVETPPPVEEVRDPVSIVMLRERYGKERAQILTDMFLETTSCELVELKAVAEAEDWIAVRSIAHGIKGACFAVLAHDMANTCRALEATTADSDFSHVRSLIQQLSAEFTTLKEFLAKT